MKFFSFYCLLAVLLLTLSACSSRQPFSTASEEKSWWYCQPQSARSWNCAQSQQELTAPAQPQSSQEVAKPEVTSEELTPIASEVLEPAVEVQSEVKVIESVASQVSEDSIKSSDAVVSLASQQALEEQVTPESLIEAQVASNLNSGDWLVQLGAFRKLSQAESLQSQIANSQIETTRINGQTWYRVYLGFYSSKQEANKSASKIVEFEPWVRRKN